MSNPRQTKWKNDMRERRRNMRANTKLIAAAPEMLEALRRVDNYFTQPGEDDWIRFYKEALVPVRRAIKLAMEGEPQGERQRTEDEVKRIVRLETGSHYWWSQKHERIWRVCYIGNDHDDNQWLHPIGSPPTKIANMDLSCFDWQQINQPNQEVNGEAERRKKELMQETKYITNLSDVNNKDIEIEL